MTGYFSASGALRHPRKMPFGFAIPVERGPVKLGTVEFAISASGCTNPTLWRFPCGNSKIHNTAPLKAQRLQEYRKRGWTKLEAVRTTTPRRMPCTADRAAESGTGLAQKKLDCSTEQRPPATRIRHSLIFSGPIKRRETSEFISVGGVVGSPLGKLRLRFKAGFAKLEQILEADRKIAGLSGFPIPLVLERICLAGLGFD
jgi:hypothetical protein